MTQDEAFVAAIAARPDDLARRLIYADWLEEQGDARAAYLRADVEYRRLPPADRRREHLRSALLRQRKGLDRGWVASLDTSLLENCTLRFDFECPTRWVALRPTERSDVRSCDACRQQVHFCTTLHEARRRALRGECVAVDTHLPRTPGDLEAPRTPPDDRQLFVGLAEPFWRRYRRWRQLPDLRHARHVQAAEPVAAWEKGMRVRVFDGVHDGAAGVIEQLDENRGRATVRLADRSRRVRVAFDDLELDPAGA